MTKPLISLCIIVYGATYERYAADLIPSAKEFFLPGESEIVVLPGEPGWPHASGVRYKLIREAAEHCDVLGDYIFLSDADNLFMAPCGREILSDGLTVTTHPGYPPDGQIHDDVPFERNPASAAFVPFGTGTQYYPGAFVGGKRESFLALCDYISAGIEQDERNDVKAIWYDESHLNRYLIDHPPALVLDRRYCYWQFWGNPEGDGAILMHRDKTGEEVASRG